MGSETSRTIGTSELLTSVVISGIVCFTSNYLFNYHFFGGKKYFKITNQNETHNGFSYRDGLNSLNESKEPFSKKGTCVPGGLYFSDVDNILRFLDYGCHLREISLPFYHPFFKMVADESGGKWRANKIILGRKWNLSDRKTFEFLISEGLDLKKHGENLLVWAITKGYIDVALFLLEIKACDLTRRIYNLMCHDDDLPLVKYIFEKKLINSKEETNDVFCKALNYDCLGIIKYVIENVIDSADLSSTITIALKKQDQGPRARYESGYESVKYLKEILEKTKDPKTETDIKIEDTDKMVTETDIKTEIDDH